MRDGRVRLMDMLKAQKQFERNSGAMTLFRMFL
jgi:hypothetical protein